MCQQNSVYPFTSAVKYSGMKFYPISYKIWFNDKGETKHTAILSDANSRSVLDCLLQDVEEID